MSGKGGVAWCFTLGNWYRYWSEVRTSEQIQEWLTSRGYVAEKGPDRPDYQPSRSEIEHAWNGRKR